MDATPSDSRRVEVAQRAVSAAGFGTAMEVGQGDVGDVEPVGLAVGALRSRTLERATDRSA
jgi:hypothetical protein